MQFNTANHTFSDSHNSGLSHYVQFYADQFSKKLVAKTLIKNAEHAINFKKKNNYLLNQFIINLQKN